MGTGQLCVQLSLNNAIIIAVNYKEHHPRFTHNDSGGSSYTVRVLFLSQK